MVVALSYNDYESLAVMLTLSAAQVRMYLENRGNLGGLYLYLIIE